MQVLLYLVLPLVSKIDFLMPLLPAPYKVSRGWVITSTLQVGMHYDDIFLPRVILPQ